MANSAYGTLFDLSLATTNIIIMKLLDFNHITFEEKCELIAVEARYLSYRYIENMKIYLYALENYFVEISFSPYHHKIVSIEAFNNVELLDPYLEFININDLHYH